MSLPLHPKTIIYLDTSTISHMVRNPSDLSPWRRLRTALAEAAAHESICCVVSEISRSEFELNPPLASGFVDLAEALDHPRASHRLDVEFAQLSRALDRFIAGAPAELGIKPPLSDAFEVEIFEWRPMFNVYLNERPSQAEIARRRETKQSVCNSSNPIYGRYARENLSREQIYQGELGGFGEGQIQDYVQVYKSRVEMVMRNVIPADALGNILATHFDVLKDQITKQTGLEGEKALKLTVEFFRSDHVRAIPVADLGARLHSHLAMSLRGPTPRTGKASDQIDIDHIATFVPYVDILVTDSYFANLCNQSNARIGDPYETRIVSITLASIDGIVEELQEITSTSPRAQLLRRMRQSLADGD